MESIKISGNIVNLKRHDINPGTIEIKDGVINKIYPEENKEFNRYITPGLVDSHVHIESSMLTPSEFSRIAAVYGTVGVVSDPHEIANILGIDGVYYMIDDSLKTPLKFCFGAPSCVPASPFETSGQTLDSSLIKKLMKNDNIGFLAEMMNYPGVINNDPEVSEKIKIAEDQGKPIDGHAPGLTGEDLAKYVSKGISTDHESITLDEAREKIKKGMKILIREGSAARNFDELCPLLEDNWEHCMFCTDDKHPDDLIKGHIDILVRKAIKAGIDPFKILTAACLNPVKHYNLDIGLLKEGDPADFLVVDNLEDFNILESYIDGRLVAKKGKSFLERIAPKIVNNFNIGFKKIEEFGIKSQGNLMNVIVAYDGQLFTDMELVEPTVSKGLAISDPDRDILKITVVNRYCDAPPSIGFIKNFGLKNGAIVSSVAHDSHNIIALGVSDKDICKAVNLVIENKGGIGMVGKNKDKILPLPIAGIISNQSYKQVANKYMDLANAAKELGSSLKAPFMTLSFMALPVIPKLKITDKGIFNSEKFDFVNLFKT